MPQNMSQHKKALNNVLANITATYIIKCHKKYPNTHMEMVQIKLATIAIKSHNLNKLRHKKII